MATRAPNCPKCHVGMKEGFELDEAYGYRTATYWVEGRPERSIWTGVKIRHKTKLEVVTYRCTACGYLESYATK